MRIAVINRTDFPTKQLKEIASALLEGQSVPNFYLVCQTPKHDGLTISNLDKPVIIITIKDLNQFAKAFVHELVHLQQHAKDYATEDFAETVITDKHRTKEEGGELNSSQP